MNLISPFKKISKKERILATFIMIIGILVLWSTASSAFIPSPIEIIKAFPRLFEQDLVDNFAKSLSFCFKSMFYATLISLVVCYLSVLPLFNTLTQFLRKFRFLPSAGLSIFFLKLGGGVVETQMSYLMIFGITTWLIDSMVGIALSISSDQIMYARSLRLNRWQTMREVLIYGKASELLSAIISNFAMAWMLLAAIENIAKASGGIGVVLQEQSKYYRYDAVYALQILIFLTGISIDYILNKIKNLIFPWTANTTL